MSKLYQYTLLNQSGNKTVFEPRKKMTLQELYKALDCDVVQVVPKVFFGDSLNKRSTIFVDEEGRFNKENKRNPHFKVLTDPWGETDIVGNALVEEVYHEK